MDTPRTIELPRRLEPVTRDTFLGAGVHFGVPDADERPAERPAGERTTSDRTEATR